MKRELKEPKATKRMKMQNETNDITSIAPDYREMGEERTKDADVA